MDDIKSIVEKITEIQGDRKYFYVSNDIEHGLGLSKYIHNFTHVCLKDSYYEDYLKEEGIDVICKNNSDLRSSAELLDGLDISNSFVQTFKISPQFESKVKQGGGQLMNTSNMLNAMFERKISQIGLFSSVEISVPKFISGKLVLLDYKSIVSNLGDDFVVQFDRGHTGLNTHFIQNETEYLNLVQIFPYREARILKRVYGKTYTLNACMTKNGLYAGGLSEQLTGIAGLVEAQGGTVGNNFNHDLDDLVIDLLTIELHKVEFLLGRNGYMGMFGLDFIFAKEENKIYIIEMNARQTMSVAFHSALQRLNGQVPLNFLHLAEYIGVRPDIDAKEYTKIGLKSIEAFQIFKRNVINNEVRSNFDFVTGEYYLNQELVPKLIDKKYSIKDISKLNFVLINQKPSVSIDLGGEILRVQVLGKDLERYINFLQNL
jgi:hypothetical protein